MLILSHCANDLVTFKPSMNLIIVNATIVRQRKDSKSVLIIYDKAELSQAVDRGDSGALALLSLTADFETADHDILLQRL